MAASILPFTPDLLPAVVRYAERTWQRPRTEDYFRWRYLESPLQRGWVTLRGEECIALLLAFARPYRAGREVVTFLEVHDWSALPELKGAGLGVRILRHAMQQPEPLLMVGGSDESRALMPRLGYGAPVSAQRFMFPVSATALAGAVSRRARVPRAVAESAAAIGVHSWFRPRRVRVPAGGRVVPVARPGDELRAFYAEKSSYGTFPLWPGDHLAWMTTGFAGAGHFVPLYFAIDDELRGFVLGRIVSTELGGEATLVTVFARRPDPALYRWMVSESIRVLASFRPNWIHAGTTCPMLGSAFASQRFLRGRVDPVWIWPKDRELPGPVAIGLDTGDTPLLPYRERWWGTGQV